jgi:hypothetical protein
LAIADHRKLPVLQASQKAGKKIVTETTKKLAEHGVVKTGVNVFGPAASILTTVDKYSKSGRAPAIGLRPSANPADEATHTR